MGSTPFTGTRSIISGYTSEEMTFMYLALEQFSSGPLSMFWLDCGKREILHSHQCHNTKWGGKLTFF